MKPGTRNSGGIAIVGISCLFPGAEEKDRFWRNICDGVDMVDHAPEGWGAERYLTSTGANRISTDRGGYLRELYRFNPAQLGVMPSSVNGSEPDQFLALQAASAALSDAGRDGADEDHTRTGIILGHSTYLHRGQGGLVQHGVVLDQTVDLLRQLLPAIGEDVLGDLRRTLEAKLPGFNPDMAPGVVPNVMTGRIANKLNFQGPNYLIDAACASSLLAVQAAMQELRSGRSDLMLTGGVNASIPAEVNMIFTQLNALSQMGKVRPFDASGDGTLMGEGLGILVLRRLEDALADGDRIYAVLRGVGQASDGRGAGLLAPRLEGEILAIRRAYEDADLEPGDGIGLIEAHGTGIPLGDRTEIAALRSVLPDRGDNVPATAIGSVKSMIGHTIPAAGAAGMIKAALALHYRILPGTLCGETRPEIGLEQSGLYVNTRPAPWVCPPGRPRRAGVNAFGFGGINTHAVLEEAPAGHVPASPAFWPEDLIVLAAGSPAALAARVRDLAGRLDRAVPDDLAAISRATIDAATGDGPCRLAIVASSVADLASKLDKAAERLEAGQGTIRMRSGVFGCDAPRSGKLAFVFPGEGAQYPGMLGGALMAFPEALEWFDFWDSLYDDTARIRPSACVFPPPTTLDGSLAKELEAALFGPEIGSESVFMASQAMLAVARRLGLTPDAVVGHSSGEHSALAAAGVFGTQDRGSLRGLIDKLKQFYKRMEAAGEIATGALLTVGAVPRERVLQIVEAAGVHLALDNCEHQAVIYGETARMDKVAEELRHAGGMCAVLPIDRPYHTPEFATAATMARDVYAGMGFAVPSLPVYSCATASRMPDDAGEIVRLAALNWESRVRFTETVRQMYADGVRTFVEIGPSANLTGFIEDTLRADDALALSFDSRRKTGLGHMLQTIGRLWVSGCAMDLAALFRGRAVLPADLSGDAKLPARMVCDNTLPVIRLSEEDAAAFRDRLPISAAPGPAAAPPASGQQADPAEGAGHPDSLPEQEALHRHLALMDRFLTVQSEVHSGLAAPASAGDDPVPLHFMERVLEQDPDRLLVEFDLDIECDPFLAEHVLYTSETSDLFPGTGGLPVVPMAVSLEIVAEAAAALCPGWHPVALERVRALDWVLVEEGFATFRAEATLVAGSGDTPRVAVALLSGDRPLVTADVRLARQPAGSDIMLPPLTSPKVPKWRDQDLYATKGMFHGPLYHSIANLTAWDEGGLDAELADTPLDGFTDTGGSTALVLNPVLLDAIGHVTAYWFAQGGGTDFSTFPSSIDRIDLMAARQEATGGGWIGGRLAFETGEDGASRFLKGDFAATAADGTPLFAVTGWRDRFFEVPTTFFYARRHPREHWYGQEVSALFSGLPEDALVWSVPAFPPGFLTDAGGIWRRLLLRTLLSEAERADFAALPPRAARQADWLAGRIAMKEAARTWIARWHGVLPFPADLEIGTTAEGKPVLVDTGLMPPEALPEISVAHVAGEAVAVAAAPGQPVGVDLESADRVAGDDLLRGGFSAEEQALVAAGGVDPMRTLRGWCAKEAAAKRLGIGLNGRPLHFRLSALGHEASVDTPELTGIRVRFAAMGNRVVAVAF